MGATVMTEVPGKFRTMSRNELRWVISPQRGPKRASRGSTEIAWRRLAYSPPLPNSYRPTARRWRHVLPTGSPYAFAMANSPSR
jgi:hypothetical protein